MLESILAAKKNEVKQLLQEFNFDLLEIEKRNFDPFQCFQAQQGRVSVIAEIKKASPLKGVLCQDFNHQTMARDYEENGAAAISVITDSCFFQGSKDYLRKVKETVNLPVLRKDFIIDEIQIYESFALGADMLLLIASINSYETLIKLSEKCLELGLEPLLEVHDKDETKMALDLPVHIIGINNRDLKNFTVDIKRSLEMASLLPASFIKVSESGINSTQDMILLEEHGFDAALIGEALVSSPDAGKKLRDMVSYREMKDNDQS